MKKVVFVWHVGVYKIKESTIKGEKQKKIYNFILNFGQIKSSILVK